MAKKDIIFEPAKKESFIEFDSVESPKIKDEKEERIKFLHEKIGEILKEYDGVSNIPVRGDHLFWEYTNELRRLMSEG